MSVAQIKAARRKLKQDRRYKTNRIRLQQKPTKGQKSKK